MLCPGCVSHGLPQAQRIEQVFGRDLTVLGLHTVFEHHAAMTPVSLEAFLYEYRIGFPVGVDQAEPGSELPVTMRRYALRGTPSLIVIDRAGRLRVNLFRPRRGSPYRRRARPVDRRNQQRNSPRGRLRLQCTIPQI